MPTPVSIQKGLWVFFAVTLLGTFTAPLINSTSINNSGTTTSTVAIINTATIGNLTVTSTANLPGTLTATVPVFTTGNLTVTSTANIQTLNAFVAANFLALSATGTSSLTTVSSTSVTIGSGTAITKFLSTTLTVDPQSIGIGSTTSSPVTLTGAALNDTVVIGKTGDWGGTSSTVQVSGSVTSANTVTVYFTNGSSTAAVNPTGMTLKVDLVTP